MKAKEPLAIVGMGCRYPGALDLAGYWRVLRDGRDALAEPASERFTHPPQGACELAMDGLGALLPDIDRFDAEFFGMSPHEASCLDPQQRLLLEVAWEAVEDAGLTRENLSGARASVFAGVWAGDFETTLYANASDLELHLITGVGRFPGPNRISYFLDLRGPSMTVDTACSSSLVAVHLAARSIWSGESEFALAGGVNVILRPEITEGFIRANMLASDRRCKFGDASADGFVRSEGAGMVVLKPLSNALRDRDRVYAVLRGTAVNNDGYSNGMLYHPSREGQESLLREACRDAGISPSDVQYVEAHGTGTKAGDPVEIETLGRVFGEAGRGRPCLVGSVKTNIGHAEGAAGVAGLIKVALSLYHGVIPASLHFQQPNPAVPWSEFAMDVPRQATAWPSGVAAIGGVSAFGLTGTNAHAVLEAAPPEGPMVADGELSKVYLVPLSAHRPEALETLARSYGERRLDCELADIAYTTALRRTHWEERLAAVVRSREDLTQALTAFAGREPHPGIRSGRINNSDRRKVAFVFPGQGAQWTGMGRQLFRDEPVFRREIEDCDVAMQRLVDWSLLDLFTGSDPLPQRIDVIQPALFAMSAALAKLWAHWGVTADAVVGHSMGEVAAAYVAGALSLSDAAAVICRRSALMRRVGGQGSMALVELPMDILERRLASYAGRLSIAASNSESSTVLSGETAAMQQLLAELDREQIFCRLIKVDVASHSAYVDPIREDLLEALITICAGPGRIPLYSTVTGATESGEALDRNYWVCNLREPVMFGRSVQQLIRDGVDIFIELSPHPLLVPSIQSGLTAAGREGLAEPSLKRDEDERQSLLSTAASLYVAGQRLNWNEINGPGRCVSLPVFPFHREPAWPEMLTRRRTDRRRGKGHPILQTPIESSLEPGVSLWEFEIDLAAMPFLADHRVLGQILFPAAGFVELALAAARESGTGPCALQEIEFVHSLVLAEGSSRRVQLALSPSAGEDRSFRLSTRGEDGAWTVLTRGRIAAGGSAPPVVDTIENILQHCTNRISGQEFYRNLSGHGVQCGPSFQLMDWAAFESDEVMVRISPGERNGVDADGFVLHPSYLDAAIQAAEVYAQPGGALPEGAYMPVSVEKLRLFNVPACGQAFYVHARRRTEGRDDSLLSVDILMLDSTGVPLLEASGVGLRCLSGRQPGEQCIFQQVWVAGSPADPPASMPGSGRWLLLADEGTTGERAASLLEALGQECVLVHRGTSYSKRGPSAYQLDARRKEDFRRLLSDAGPVRGILHLWSLDIASLEDGTTSPDVAEPVLESAAFLVSAISEADWHRTPRFWLATAGLQDIGGHTRVALSQSPLWGLGRVIACEHPELRPTNLDLSPAPSDDEIRLLAQTLLSETPEDQIVLRGGTPYFARYQSAPRPESRPVQLATRDAVYQAVSSDPGNLDGVVLDEVRRVAPAAGEVEIAVVAAGLNFLDVLKSLGQFPGIAAGAALPLGAECAGRVVAVGPGVEGFRVGDEVVAITPSIQRVGMLASNVVVPAKFASPKPARLSMEEAATSPMAFLTASYALHNLARMQAGERVLIQAGAGGVGLAAIQLAQRAGAIVFATAGSPEKRAFLQRLGVAHVFDSRSTSFAAEVLKATDSEGVDIVLNSLSGDFLRAGIETLAPYGRFVEIGKRDFYANSGLGLWPFRRNLSFLALDLGAMLEQRPKLVSSLLKELLDKMETGALEPLPCREFAASELADAFRHMATAKHIGKIAVTFRETSVTVRPPSSAVAFRPDAEYLMTGGLGGISLHTSRWMVQNGARHLVLAGRSAPSASAQRAIAEMQALGCHVRTFQADVSNPEDVARLLQFAGESRRPLAGIVHAAAVVDDVLVHKIGPGQFWKAMQPKARGAWNLHCQTSGMDLDFFVMYSSIASMLPLPGQGSYAAANVFLDALARYRRVSGKPGLSINWGAWINTGLALSKGAITSTRSYATRGFLMMSPTQGLEALSYLCSSDLPGALAVPVDWRRVAQAYAAEAIPPILSSLVQEQVKAAVMEVRTEDPVSQLRLAPPEQRREILESHLRTELSRVLRLEPARIARDKRLGAMGLDSLMAVSFVRRLSSSLGIALPATAAFNYPTLALLATHVAGKLGVELETHQAAVTVQEAPQPGTRLSLEDVSEEQAIQALLSKGVQA